MLGLHIRRCRRSMSPGLDWPTMRADANRTSSSPLTKSISSFDVRTVCVVSPVGQVLIDTAECVERWMGAGRASCAGVRGEVYVMGSKSRPHRLEAPARRIAANFTAMHVLQGAASFCNSLKVARDGP